jgi:hypothetical protein
MKSQALSFCFALLTALAAGQNLVPNPSFENMEEDCDTKSPAFFGARHWFNANSATPDFYGPVTDLSCWMYYYASEAMVNVGEFISPRTGQKMAGIYAGQGLDQSRDILEVRLSDTLKADWTYCVEFYVRLARRVSYATDCFGVYFSEDSLVNHSSPAVLNNIQHIGNPAGELLLDTVNWVSITGTYVATGGEKFLLLGNLKENSECLFYEWNPGADWTTSYYYVDDVSVIACDSIVGQQEIQQPDIRLYPNPASEFLFIEGEIDNIEIVNLLGISLFHSTQRERLLKIPIGHWPSGMYVARMAQADRVAVKSFFIHH